MGNVRNLYLWLECKLSGRSWRAENARLGVRREAAHDLARLWVLQLDAHGKRVGRLGDAEVVELGAHVRAEGRRVLLDKDALACTELERLRHDNDVARCEAGVRGPRLDGVLLGEGGGRVRLGVRASRVALHADRDRGEALLNRVELAKQIGVRRRAGRCNERHARRAWGGGSSQRCSKRCRGRRR